MSWEGILKHDARETNMKNLREYIKKDTESAEVLKYLYDKWEKEGFGAGKIYDTIRAFIRSLDDFGTMGWER